MQCPQCNFDNPPQMKFCGQCGTQLQTVCPSCKTEVPPGFKFCGECGTALGGVAPASASPPSAQADAAAPTRRRQTYEPPILAVVDHGADQPSESEIKQVTVLSAELVCTATPADALDPERLHSLLSEFFELARAEIQRYGGTVHQLLSQGMTALFGAPIAHEDHGRRGVLAALALQQKLAERSADVEGRHGVRWTARIGLDTGPVVVGGVGDMAVGGAPAVAERLQQAAPPGAVLVSGDTGRLVATDVELTAAEPLAGEDAAAEKTEVWRVSGAVSTMQSVSPFREQSVSPFVGRGRELAILAELYQQAVGGHGQVVGIVGEAGAGKSRLLYEFRKTVQDEKVSYLRGQCLSYGVGIPYLPLIGLIRSGSRIAETDSAAAITSKLRVSLEWAELDSDETLPYFLRLLGVAEGTEALEEMEPQTIQSRTFAHMRRMLLNAARRSQVVVLELEDLHWLDETSEDFLDSLVEMMAAARMLLLLSYRSGYQPRWLEKSYSSQISLRSLTPGDSETLLDAILRQAELDAELASEILDKANGNPFFLEQLARSVTEHGRTAGEAIPNTIQGVLMARIDRLPVLGKRLLQTASVLGRELTLELLEAIWDRPEPPAPLLHDLQRWEFIYQAPSEDQTVFFFKHALTQEVAYQSLLTSRRRGLHRRAGAALEELYADRLEDAYGLLIHHYPKAGEPDKTVHYLTLFAARAARNYSHAEAAKALREALEHAEQLPADIRDLRLIEVLLQLAESLLPLAGFPETLELFQRYGDHLQEIDDPSVIAQYHFWLAHTHTYLGHQEQVGDHAERAIAAARECGDEATEGKTCYVLGRDGFWSGRFSEGAEHSARAVMLLERSGEPWWQGQAYWVAGFQHYVLGRFEAALEALERARSIGEALDDYRLDSSWSIGYFHASLGEAEAGIEQCQRGLERAQDPLNTAVSMGFLGYAYLEKGDFAKAIETLRESVERLRHTGMQHLLGWFSAFLGEACLLAGKLDEARDLVSQGLEVSREARFQYGIALGLRAMGRIARAAGEPVEAKTQLLRARETFESLQVPFEVGRTRLDLAALAHAEGDADAAAEELEAARRLFLDLRVPNYVERTAELAEELQAASSEP